MGIVQFDHLIGAKDELVGRERALAIAKMAEVTSNGESIFKKNMTA